MSGWIRRLIPLLLFAVGAAPLRAEITAKEVRDALERGVTYLKKQQNPTQGNWPEYESEIGGLTALATLALLSCGEKPDSPEVAKALKYLDALPPPKRTYAASLQIMAFAAADPKRYKLKITAVAHFLEARQIKSGETKGGWTYSDANRGDNSNTQFAMLALHEAERAGVKIADETWQLALDYWLSKGMQKPDGAFGYIREEPPTGSMTCAAIASLILATDRLHPGDASAVDGQVRCCGNQPREDEIEQALDWLGRKFTVTSNPNVQGFRGIGQSHPWLLYYLYGVERVGRMSGRRFLGSHDWFREGAEFLVNEQRKSIHGNWTGTGIIENNPIVATSFALLFLSKGKRPVVISRLKHSEDNGGRENDWDSHRRSVQNLTARVEKLWQKDLSWQTIDARHASLQDLLETPVLFVSGSQSLKLTKEQKHNLKEYVNQGGFLFVEACDGNGCNGAEFDKAFRALMTELFPESPLRKLPPDHAVWYAQEVVAPESLPQDAEFWLWGLDTCCRTSVVYCPRPLSCYWELVHPYRSIPIAEPAKSQAEAVMKIGGNVLAYATNRDLKEKLDRPQVAVNQAKVNAPRGSLTVPKLAHGGGADDAPNALANLLRVVEQKLEIRVNHERRPPLNGNDPLLLDHPLVFMHGRRTFRFNAAERKALKDYLDRGGFIFADAICASPQFAEAVRTEFKAIYPDGNFIRLPAEHPLLTEEMQGFDLRSVTLRDPLLRIGDDPLKAKLIETAPLLEALEVDGRIAVVLSPYDISCALEKGASMECKGYITADAAKLGANVILYALQQ